VILEFPSERGYFSSMKPQTLNGLETRLTHFLEDLLEPMGRRERRHWARVYVQGLLLDGERKSIELMASRIVGAEVQALRQFVGQSPWAVNEVHPGSQCLVRRHAPSGGYPGRMVNVHPWHIALVSLPFCSYWAFHGAPLRAAFLFVHYDFSGVRRLSDLWRIRLNATVRPAIGWCMAGKEPEAAAVTPPVNTAPGSKIQ
jgi:hypothetical protein